MNYKEAFKKLIYTHRGEILESEEDFKNIPLVTRKELHDFSIADCPVPPRAVYQTTGTSGSPLLIFYSPEAVETAVLRIGQIIQKDKKRFDTYSILNLYAYGNLATYAIEEFLRRQGDLIIPLGMPEDAKLLLARKIIQEVRPRMITTSVSFCYDLFLGLAPGLVKSIACSGSLMTSEFRERLKKTTGAKIFDCYGCNEVGLIAMGDEEKYVYREGLYLEVLDDEGNIQSSGEGKLLLTDLYNYSMPIIRYLVGDRIILKECEGKQYLTVLGRDDSLTNINSAMFSVNTLIQSVEKVLAHNKFLLLIKKDSVSLKDQVFIKVPLEEEKKIVDIKSLFLVMGLFPDVQVSSMKFPMIGEKYINFLDARKKDLPAGVHL